MLDKHKNSFYRKLNLDRETKELIYIYLQIKKKCLQDVEGRKNDT